MYICSSVSIRSNRVSALPCFGTEARAGPNRANLTVREEKVKRAIF